MPDSELIATPEGKDIQRNVNLSPGAAPKTSFRSSQICSICQRRSRAEVGVVLNDYVSTSWLREAGEVGVILKYGDVFWEVFVGTWDKD